MSRLAVWPGVCATAEFCSGWASSLTLGHKLQVMVQGILHMLINVWIHIYGELHSASDCLWAVQADSMIWILHYC